MVLTDGAEPQKGGSEEDDDVVPAAFDTQVKVDPATFNATPNAEPLDLHAGHAKTASPLSLSLSLLLHHGLIMVESS